MKIKTLAIVTMLIIIGSSVVTSANVKHNNDIENTTNDIDDVIEIRVAIYTDEKETDLDFYSPYARTRYFIWALRDYSWKVGDTLYRFVPTLLSTKRLLKGELTIDNYDVLLYTPEQADTYLLYTGFSRLPKNKIRVRNVANFVKDGGGYFGTCGGALIAGDMENKPTTFAERAMKNSCLGISCANIQWKTTIPLFYCMLGREPKAMGEMAYVWYSGWNQTNYSINFHSGACLDCSISKDNPIFDDHIESTRRILWMGAPAFEIPEIPDREISALARFPIEEISNNKSTDIHYWKYTGGIRGLISAAFYNEGEIHWMETFSSIPLKAFIYAGDWERTDKVVETNLSNKPFMTAEVYPNENNARIVRCTGHPEYNVWWGGHIEEMEDTEINNQYEGFYRWKNVLPEDETVEDEFSYNYWIVRRSVAWASQKVPDNDLPPIYGPSQVSDIFPYNQSSSFTIAGNAESSDGIASLELLYRCSSDNENWSAWTLYETDVDSSDGWSWEFNASNGTGYYQFYSIRHVEYEGYTETETATPGPDATARVVE